jgi:hypothetical protein
MKRMRNLASWLLVIVILGLTAAWWNRRTPVAPIEIYPGITYGCESTGVGEKSGLVHWARIDLTAPGIELYVTPVDPYAAAHGWQYRLRTTGEVARTENLAVAVNATYHRSSSISTWLPLPGDFARTDEALISDHKVTHIPEHTYLFWFTDDLVPDVETERPPKDSVLQAARWAVGGRGAVLLKDGRVPNDVPTFPADARTALGFHRERHLLILAAFENASPRNALEKLLDLGAEDGMLLDGGASTSMALGKESRSARSGTLIGGWRPVATHFGVRARPIPPPKNALKP